MLKRISLLDLSAIATPVVFLAAIAFGFWFHYTYG